MRKKRIRFAALLALLVLLPAWALGAEYAVVRGGRLNLREYASTSSRSLGKYDAGTWVRVDGYAMDGWYAVHTLNGRSGYMSGDYLSFSAGANTATVRYANGGYVNLRSGPSLDYSVVMRVTSGSSITILNDAYEWNYVSVNAYGSAVNGYMHDSLINRSVSAATVTTRNGGKVNVRSGPGASFSSIGRLASGTRVNVLLRGNGWYQISANGMVGFMSTQYLSGTGSTVGSNTGTTTSLIAYVNNPRSTQVLYLRESPSQNARALGQYRNGTKVKVVKKGSTWCEVYVGTRHGYMMTRYLSFNGGYVQPVNTRVPIYVYPTATPEPLVQYITPEPLVQYITPRPTAIPQYITPVPAQPAGPAAPKAGDAVTLCISAGSSSSTVNVYHDSSLTRLKASYPNAKQAMMLQYGQSVCMVYVDGGVAYVSTRNINY